MLSKVTFQGDLGGVIFFGRVRGVLLVPICVLALLFLRLFFLSLGLGLASCLGRML